MRSEEYLGGSGARPAPRIPALAPRRLGGGLWLLCGLLLWSCLGTGLAQDPAPKEQQLKASVLYH